MEHTYITSLTSPSCESGPIVLSGVSVDQIRFGPNTFPAHNSVIFSSEVQADYISKTLFKPIIDHHANIVEVKEDAEEGFVHDIERKLQGSVFAAGCSNWYINAVGRNSASWPGKAADFWRQTMFPKWKAYELHDGDRSWPLRSAWRQVRTMGFASWALIGAALFFASRQQEAVSLRSHLINTGLLSR